MSKISCIIVDDEKTAREGLSLLLQDFPEISVIGTCKNGVEAIDQIRAYKPNLLLLDIQMPVINGFEVLASIPQPYPTTIFITAHDEYALKAFEVNAIDYLLKPFSDKRFAEAMERAIQKITTQQNQQLSGLLRHTKSSLQQPTSLTGINEDRLVIRSDGSVHLVNFADIVFIEAFDYYVKIHVADRFYLLRETMKNMEVKLGRGGFCRIHKSYIVNLQKICSVEKQDSGDYLAVLNDGIKLKVSRGYRGGLMDSLSQ
ncbi:MAG: LytTR family DNA-binding domain-containing protein [Marinoscillum sp.]